MKRKAKTVLSILTFILAIPLIGATYYVVDTYRAAKGKRRKTSVYTPTFHSYYPDEPATDFNEWSKHIYRLNNHKN